MEGLVSAMHSSYEELASSILRVLEAEEQRTQVGERDDTNSKGMLADLHWNIQRFCKACDAAQDAIDSTKRQLLLGSQSMHLDQQGPPCKVRYGSKERLYSQLQEMHALLLNLQKIDHLLESKK